MVYWFLPRVTSAVFVVMWDDTMSAFFGDNVPGERRPSKDTILCVAIDVLESVADFGDQFEITAPVQMGEVVVDLTTLTEGLHTIHMGVDMLLIDMLLDERIVVEVHDDSDRGVG